MKNTPPSYMAKDPMDIKLLQLHTAYNKHTLIPLPPEPPLSNTHLQPLSLSYYPCGLFFVNAYQDMPSELLYNWITVKGTRIATVIALAPPDIQAA